MWRHEQIQSFCVQLCWLSLKPIAAIIVSLAAYFIPVMPWLLSFVAGAMIYVVVEELIPEAKLGEHSDLGPLP